jgi:phosphoribosylamine--glycine ligase
LNVEDTTMEERVLIVGGGGREHALAWRCLQEGHSVWAVPGNDAMARDGVHCEPGAGAQHLVALARRESISLVIVGPEQPLVDGLADTMRAAGFATLGPSSAAAQLEGSKAFSKAFMARHGIPTARFVVCEDLDAALAALRDFDGPPVIKASGLAAGKGVTVPESFEEAETAIRECLADGRFGAAGSTVVLEERLEGEEASYFVLTDGTHAVSLAACQDHKRIFDGDRGPNTGGMGAYCPAPVVTEAVERRVLDEVVSPTLAGLRQDGTPFVGVLFVGLMIDGDGAPRVIEYNVRFGDPEAQPLMVGTRGELVSLMGAAARGELASDVRLEARPACSVVLASAGYPRSSTKGVPLLGLPASGTCEDPHTKVFHAGSRWDAGSSTWVTNGGRVLGVCGQGDDLSQAVRRAYAVLDEIECDGAQVRRDIAARALRR